MITLTKQCTKPGLYEHWFKELQPDSTADRLIVGLARHRRRTDAQGFRKAVRLRRARRPGA